MTIAGHGAGRQDAATEKSGSGPAAPGLMPGGVFVKQPPAREEQGRRVDEVRLEAMLALTRMTEHTVKEIADFALNAAVGITESTIGYLAFTNEEESVLTMHSWSGGAMEECRIMDKTFIYPMETVGLWGEAVRQRRPIITNDYQAPSPWKRGYPDGHVPILRHMNIPVFHGERIVAVAGVGNKAADYDEHDVSQLTLLMQEMWTLILRKQDQEKLREREEHYRTLFENSMIGFALHDPEKIIDCNEQACRMMRMTREEMIGKTAVQMSPPMQSDGRASGEMAWENIGAALDGAPQQFTWQLLRGDGQVIDVRVGLKVLTVGGKKMVMAAVEDITEQKRAEEERRKLELQMQQSQKLESLGVLAGGIAHDFNNMLMAILGNADLALLHLSEVSPARPMLKEIEKASRRAADLCRQMLAYSGKGRFVIQRVDLSRVVEEMTHMLEVSISKKAVLEYHFTQELPVIEADVTQLRQIIMNLIVNASEAIGDRSGHITVSTGLMYCDRQYLTSTYLSDPIGEGWYVCLEVSDTGCGMDPATIKRIFEPFYTTKFTGRGLGLAAVLGIVRGHKGALKVYSEPGRGTSFKVLFPAIQDGAAEPQEAPAAAVDGRWRASGTVLLVDDEEEIRKICGKILNHLGLTVLTARDGREAVQVYKENMERTQCVILDLMMPHMDGEEAFRALRQLNREVRVILASGYTEQEVTPRFLGKGLVGFIQKPFQTATLVEELKKVFGG